MAVFKKQGVYWIDYYVNGHRKQARIGADKRLAETVLSWRGNMWILRRPYPDGLLSEAPERKVP